VEVFVNVLLALVPTLVMAVMQTTMIIASITAYSTAVGPSSLRQKSAASFFKLLTPFLLFVKSKRSDPWGFSICSIKA
jgi:hypothetical protein